MEYIIEAYSPSTGHKLRELQLESPAIQQRQQAQWFAESFARRLNQARHLDVSDWEPRLDQVDPNFHARTL